MNQNFGSGDIGCHRDIVHIAEPEEVHVVGLMGLGAQGVTEKQKQVNLVAGNAGRNLLVAALRAAEETLNLQSCSF